MGWNVLHPSLQLGDCILSIMKFLHYNYYYYYFIFFRETSQEIRF